MKHSSITVAAALLITTAPIKAQDSFLESDTYLDGEKIVGVLLSDDEYGLMVEGAEYFDSNLDWAWVRGQQSEQEGAAHGVSIGDYQSIVVEPPVDYTAAPIDGLAEILHEVLTVSARRLGWVPGERGDLVLRTAIVDVLDAEGAAVTGFFNATKRHMLELEFRLAEADTDTVLLVAREEVNSGNLIGAMWRAAAHLTTVLASPVAPRYSARGSTVSLDAYEMPATKRNKPHALEKWANPRELALDAIRSSGIFAEVAEASSDTDYGLEIEVVDANYVGAFQTTVNVNASYTLTNHRTGNVLRWENIGTSATLSASDVRKGGERLLQVTPAAFLNNIDVFLLRLDAELDESD